MKLKRHLVFNTSLHPLSLPFRIVIERSKMSIMTLQKRIPVRYLSWILYMRDLFRTKFIEDIDCSVTLHICIHHEIITYI
jgi:hypothetical protein